VAAIPQPLQLSATVRAIYAKYEERRAATPARGYLGASVIGHACDRYLWLSFRWAGGEQFYGIFLRLFDQVHRAEQRFVEELRSIGAEVHAEAPAGGQFAVDACGGHFKGHLDGCAIGLPEAPKTWHVLEFKTHNARSFKQLQAEGVKASKPMHWAQMQVYMLLTGMQRALYLAENKDNAELYEERVALDKPEAARLIERAQRIVNAAEPPPRLSTDPAWHVCRYCPFHAQCHGTAVPAPTCRTCTHSTPEPGGTWSCAQHAVDDVHVSDQAAGCAKHRYIPVLLERIGAPVDSDGDAVTYRTPEGKTFVNGSPPAGFTSDEIFRAADKRALTNVPEMQQWREQLGAQVVA
jgi:hypothetical protein